MEPMTDKERMVKILQEIPIKIDGDKKCWVDMYHSEDEANQVAQVLIDAGCTFINCVQRQNSLTDQMNTVIDLARRYGCYDAQDWIKNNFAKKSSLGLDEEKVFDVLQSYIPYGENWDKRLKKIAKAITNLSKRGE